MRIRIKPITKKDIIEFAVQIKKRFFWKTISITKSYDDAKKNMETLKEINQVNNEFDVTNKIVFEGWGVRNLYKNGDDFRLHFYRNYPIIRKNGENEIFWKDGVTNDVWPFIEINMKKLFNKNGLDPIKLRITIEELQ